MSLHQILGGALAVQVVLAAITWWPQGDTTVQASPLIDGGADAITGLVVQRSGDEAEPVELKKEGEAWVIASAGNYPAEASKVTEVIDAIGEIKLRAPIATRAVSHEALGVTDDGYEKKITVNTSAGDRTFLLGAAASKAIHLREAGSDDVYMVKGLSAWTIKDNVKGYQPANYLDLSDASISSFGLTNASGSVAFLKEGDTWVLDGVEGMEAISGEVQATLDKATTVRLGEPVGTEVLPEHGLTNPGVRIEYTTAEADDTNLAGGYVVGAEADGKLYVKDDAQAFVVLAPTYKLKDLIELDVATLTRPAAPAPDEAPPE